MRVLDRYPSPRRRCTSPRSTTPCPSTSWSTQSGTRRLPQRNRRLVSLSRWWFLSKLINLSLSLPLLVQFSVMVLKNSFLNSLSLSFLLFFALSVVFFSLSHHYHHYEHIKLHTPYDFSPFRHIACLSQTKLW